MTSATSAPTVVESSPSNPELPAARLYIEKKQWDVLRRKIELRTRILCFRYPKPSTSRVGKLVVDCIGYEVRKEDAYYEKGCTKAFQNISSWKYETIEAMIRWVKKLLDAKPMLANIREDKLYDEMRKNFDAHAAEAVFAHVASHYRMHVGSKSPAGVWISDFFCNLAVMVKLHLDDMYAADTCRAVVLDFYDMFGRVEIDDIDEDERVVGTKIEDNPVYAGIKISDFKKRDDKKPTHAKKVIKRRLAFGCTTLFTSSESTGTEEEPTTS